MRKFLYIYVLIILLMSSALACSQTSEVGATVQYSRQTQDSLVNQLKKYDYEPNYQIRIDTQNSYDILVNNLLMAYDYGSYRQVRSFQINWSILKAGKQRLQIKYYPQFRQGKLTETLTNEDYLEITVSSFTWRKDNNGIENQKEVLKYTLPQKDKNGNNIDYSQKKGLIIDLEFEAEVPYELKGWTDGVIFNKKDSIELKRKLASIYQERINNFKNKEFDTMLAQSIYRDYEIGQSIYDTKESFTKSQTEYDKIKDEDLNFKPLENYELFFYGDGRLITLRRTDNKYLGDSPFIRTYINDRGVKRAQFLNFNFYQPQGSDKLVLIR